MKIDMTKEEIGFINRVFNTVKVNEVVVDIQSLFQVLQKINTPVEESIKEPEKEM